MGFSPLFSAQLDGNVWMDNGCLGGPVGCPIAGATITASGMNDGTTPDVYTTVSDDSGHFMLDISAGYYHVTCSKEGWITQEENLYVGEDGAQIDFNLPEADDNPYPENVFFSGHVYGPMGDWLPAFEHIAGAHVEVMGGSNWGFELYFETETNNDGYFEFEYSYTPGGEWFADALVIISAEGYTTHEEWINFSEPVIGHEFYLNPSEPDEPTDAYFTGNVFSTYPNSTGLPTPIHNAHVKLYGGFTGGLLAETETNDNGYFEFGDVVMSAQSYSIEAEGYLPIEGSIWDFCTNIDPTTIECFPIYADFYLEPEDTDPECEDLSDFHFGDCEMVIGIGFNGEECMWYSGCGTEDQNGIDHANSFFESIEACEEACGHGDDGGDDGGDDPFSCLMDCEGMSDLNPEEDPDGACEWFLGLTDSVCIADCNEEVFSILAQITEVCEMCLDGMFDCSDIFDDGAGDDGGDDGAPECLMDCEGIYDVDPDEDPDATCEWLIETLSPNNECTSDCEGETLIGLIQLSGLCEECLMGAFDCADVFNDDCDPNLMCDQVETCIDGLLYPTSCGSDNCDEPISECNGGGNDGVLYGYVEYIWGDAIEIVAGAHIMIQSISPDGTMIDVYETTTNDWGQYEIDLPMGGYIVTASAYDDFETHDVYIESGQEHELNFQLGEFDYPNIYALSGIVNGSDGPNSDYYPLSGAQVRAEGISSGEVFETNAGEGGYYWLYLPYPDAYSVTVSHDGYESASQIFEVFGILEANFFLNSQGGVDAEAILSLGDGNGNAEGFTVPLYLNSSQPVSGIQFAVVPMAQTGDYYFIPGEVEVLNDCFSGDGNDVYGQLWGIIFSLEGCVYEPGQDHHVANLSFTVEGDVPAGAQVPMVFNYTLVSDPDANEIPSAGEGSMVTFGQLGDVNGDNAINVVDIVNMVNFALQIDEPSEYESWAADLNQDGDINILDIVSVVNIILYGNDLHRYNSGDAEIYHNEKEVHIKGSHVAGFQIEFAEDIDVNQIQIPDGWISKSHGHFLMAYALDGILLNGRSIIKLNQSAEIVELIIADANGDAILTNLKELPLSVTLKGNFPNPFNPETSIAYTLSHDSQVMLSVYDLSGRLVEKLVDGQQYPGQFSVSWLANSLPSGMYIAQLIVNGESFTKKMMLMK